MKKKLLFVASLFIACFAIAKPTSNTNFFKEPLTEYTKKDHRKDKGCFNYGIRFFEDDKGKKFVLKYQDSTERAIHDTLGAQIGTAVDIPVNQVILLPAGSQFMGEFLNTATLHTHAPGQEVFDIKDMPYLIDIKGGLASKINLESITKNKDLRNIVALNLYINNEDCHKNNLFFNKETNQFCAIDFGNSFDGSAFASNSLYFVEKLRRKKLSPAEVEALKDVSEKLVELASAYPAEKIYDEWMNIANKANYTYSSNRKEWIKKVRVEYNCYEANNLRSEIDSTIKAQDIPYAVRRMAEPGKKAQQDFWRTMNS